MKIAIGSDEKTPLTDAVVQDILARGHKVELYGALGSGHTAWPDVAEEVASKVAEGKCQEGILFCWTGTGMSIAANKVPGVRAALCFDAEMARGSRLWNHANVLVMSLRLTSPAVAKEILEAWFATPFGSGEDADNVAKVSALEQKIRRVNA